MTHLVNDLDAIVTEALDGLVRASGGALARLDGYPDIKVVLRADWTKDRVAVVSGGGAGHEPAHAGFVGQGMLTAAVCGEIFASPSVDAMYAAICAVTGDAGCLVIAKNYTGDRLAFGLAVERARAAGFAVELVVVGDDVALPGVAQPRGIAGTVLVHKLAGAAAERGAALQEVAGTARRAADGLRSIGVSLSSVSIPGRSTGDRIAEGRAELGLGIHGEPGASTVDVDSSAALVRRMTAQLQEGLPDGSVALLVNNLGGLATLELGVVLRDVLDTELGSRAELVVGPAALMTSLSASGFSISVLPLEDGFAEGLTTPPAPHTAWPAARTVVPLDVRPVADLRAESAPPSANPRVRELVRAVGQALVDAEAQLNDLDARVGDGDTGSTFATVATRVIGLLDELPLDDTGALLATLSTVLATTMGGSSGVLGSIFLAAAATSVRDGAGLPDALADGTRAMQQHGGAAPGDRTMLDALVPAIGALRADGARAAADAAEAGAARTAQMTTAQAGRSALVPAEHLADVQDPGAAAVAVMFRAAADAGS